MAVKLRYKSPPLPFIGNKRNWLGLFAETVSALPPSTVFVDCFGGSGILSRTAADACPGARVIYNDYDDYADRVASIPVTNAILRELRDIMGGVPRGAKVPGGVKAQGLEVLRRYRELFGGIDEATVTANVAFSSRNVESGIAEKATWYNRVRLADIPEAPGYFDGLEVVRADFRELLARYADDPDAVFVLDPPYLSTQCDAYGAYGGLVESLDTLAWMRGRRYIYYSSDKSEIERLVRWVADYAGEAFDLFAGATRHERRVTLAATRKGEVIYTDRMYVKL